MASDVLYVDDSFKPYFDMNRFEDSIYYRTSRREVRIKNRRRIRVFDKILSFVVMTLFIYMVVILSQIMIQKVKIAYKKSEVKRLEIVLQDKKYSSNLLLNDKKATMKFDDLKMKAYMELNMITPTDKNTIYFDKSDNGFVRQYENIR